MGIQHCGTEMNISILNEIHLLKNMAATAQKTLQGAGLSREMAITQ